MSDRLFRALVLGVALLFAGVFTVVVLPPLLEHPDFVGAALAGFVNPYAAGYSTDTILCWVVLAIWVTHEATTLGIRHGWICLLLGLVPGVATGFGLYLITRSVQLRDTGNA